MTPDDVLFIKAVLKIMFGLQLLQLGAAPPDWDRVLCWLGFSWLAIGLLDMVIFTTRALIGAWGMLGGVL